MPTEQTDIDIAGAPSGLSRFRGGFWQPPRAHGEVIEDRTVSFLELFYDLVYVVVIARAAHTLADQVSWRSFFDFAVVFGLIWVAWMNGTMYHEGHGREDGRTRLFVFVQMSLLALLAVFASGATGDSGTEFAIVYATFMAVLTWLWQTVRRRDVQEFTAATARYQAGMVGSIVVMAASALLPTDTRVLVWAIFVGASIGGGMVLSRSSRFQMGVTATHSMVERFGLFVIIVFGEMVAGVVGGLSEAARTPRSIITGMIAMMIGFAYWWVYFDFVGRRLPHNTPHALASWIYGHLPVTLSIAAAGAAMVSLIEHAEDRQAPTATSWLLAGSVALGLAGLVVRMRALRDYDHLPWLYRPAFHASSAAAGAALLTGWWRPVPWLFALTLVVLLAAVWFIAVERQLRLGVTAPIR